jgi:transposase-like protein
MSVQGISTPKLRGLWGDLWGAPVSSATVPRVTLALDYEVDAFLRRELEDDTEDLYLDGIRATLRQLGIEGKVMLVALGVHRDGTKEVLSSRLEEGETAASWEALLTHLKRRGPAGEALRLVITDGGSRVIAGVVQAFPGIRRQRCLVRTFREVRQRTKALDNVTPNADPIKRISREIAEAMNRSWRGATLQAISTTDEARPADRSLRGTPVHLQSTPLSTLAYPQRTNGLE